MRAVPPPPPPPRRVNGPDAANAERPPAARRSAASSLVTADLLTRPSVTLCRWPDPVIDRLGHDPRSPYAECYWLPILGPSALWLLRLLVNGFEDHGPGEAVERYELDLLDAPRAIGVGGRGGKHSPFANTVNRLIQFGFLQLVSPTVLAVRTHMPALTRRQLLRLPDRLREAHDREVEEHQRALEPQVQSRRARALARSLLELGEDVHTAEKQLHRWHFHPAVAFEAVRGAAEQHGLADASEGAAVAKRSPSSPKPITQPHAGDGAA